MIRVLTVAMFIVFLHLTPAQAADKYLVSKPIPGGAGGLVCACTNLTKSSHVVTFIIQHKSGGGACTNLPVPSGGVQDCERPYTSPSMCKVRRIDGLAITTKQFSCTLSALDGSGNPLAVVAVDKKYKNP